MKRLASLLAISTLLAAWLVRTARADVAPPVPGIHLPQGAACAPGRCSGA
ncbi:MAG: hypothetical protein SXV54_21850 [Chloroflexota bacterium]|nr:hypothetical protein [Chloroflexota bacterium]